MTITTRRASFLLQKWPPSVRRVGGRARGDAGYTLVETLMVIVILAILAGMLLFAVNGLGERATASTCQTDVATVTVAAEAYNARAGHYPASMEALVAAGLLRSVPGGGTYHLDYQVTGEGDGQAVTVSSTSCPVAAGGSSTAPTSSPQSSAAPPSGKPGDDPTSLYCAALTSAKGTYGGLSMSTVRVNQVGQADADLEKAATLAPSAVKQAWQDVVDTVRRMQQIVADTRLTPEQLDALSAGKLPAGFTRKQSDQLDNDLSAQTSGGVFRRATDKIDEHADRLCV